MLDDASPALQDSRKRLSALGARLHANGLDFRAPPPEPTTCCGKGCNGCVWEGYFAAVDYWCEQAGEMLARVPLTPALSPEGRGRKN